MCNRIDEIVYIFLIGINLYLKDNLIKIRTLKISRIDKGLK
jgi:hypothetical protein